MVKLSEIREEKLKNALLFRRKIETKIIECWVNEDKLVSVLNDGREISIPVSLLTKWSILGDKVTPEQLKKNEIQSEGRIIYFPDIDETLPTWIIDKGLNVSCLE